MHTCYYIDVNWARPQKTGRLIEMYEFVYANGETLKMSITDVGYLKAIAAKNPDIVAIRRLNRDREIIWSRK